MVRELLEDHDAPLIWIPSWSYIGASGQNVKSRYVGEGNVRFDWETDLARVEREPWREGLDAPRRSPRCAYGAVGDA
jgi:hypothetical protein